MGSSAAVMGGIMVTRGLIAPMLFEGYAGLTYDELSLKYPGMDHDAKRDVSTLSAAFQTALDFVGVEALHHLPGLKSLLTQPLSKMLITRAGIRVVAVNGVENTVEGLQDAATPLLLALRGDVPGFDWEEEKRVFWRDRVQVGIAMLPLTLLGIGVSTVQEYRGAKELLFTNDRLGAAGIVETDRIAITDAARKGDYAGATTRLQQAWANRSPEVAAEYQERLDKQQAQDAHAFAEASRLGMLPQIQLQNGRYTVTEPDGKATEYPSWEAARNAANLHLTETEARNIDAVGQLADYFVHQQLPGLTESIILQAGPAPDVRTLASPEKAAEAVRVAGQLEGMSPAEAQKMTWVVFGSNQVAQRGHQRASISRIFHEGNVLTTVEEVVEGRLKASIAQNLYTREDWRGWVRLAEQAAGQTFLPVGDQEIMAASEVPRALIEAVSAITTADVLGRRKDGSRLPAGAITEGLRTAIQRGTVDAKEGSRLLQFLRAARSYFGQVLQRAAALKKAQREGKLGADWQSQLDSLLGFAEGDRGGRGAEQKGVNQMDAAASFSLSERIKRAAASPALQVGDLHFWRGITASERTKRAKTEAAKIMADGPIHNKDRGKEIYLSVSGVKHWARFAADPRKAALLGHLRELFSKAIYLRSEDADARYNHDKTVMAFHKLALPVRFGDEEAIARLTVREDVNGRWVYDGKILEIESAPADSPKGRTPLESENETQQSDIQQAREKVLHAAMKVNEDLTAPDSFSLQHSAVLSAQPTLIQPLAPNGKSDTLSSNELREPNPSQDPDRVRDPAAIHSVLTGQGGGHDLQRPNDRGRVLRSSGQERRKHGRELASYSRVMAWAEAAGNILAPTPVVEAGFADAPGGGEHRVLLDKASNRVVKLTKPGFAGAQGEDAGAYIQRLALANWVFGDDIAFEGVVTLPGEHAPRLVSSQPAIKGRDATDAELSDYLSGKGFHYHEGRWIHPIREVAVWDTITPGNAITRSDGSVMPIDLQVEPARADELDAVRQSSGIGRATSFSLSPTRNPNQIDTPIPIPYDSQYGPSSHTRRDAQAALRELTQSAEDDARRSLQADAGERLHSEAQSMVSWARQSGWIIDRTGLESLTKSFKELQGGAEHHVAFDQSSGRVLKVTIPPNFGARGALVAYLHNIAGANQLFHDDIRFEGIIEHASGPAVVTSQPFIVGREPTEAEVTQWMEAQGYLKDGYNKWRHPDTGAVIADTHPGNFILTESGILVPIDLQILNPGKSTDSTSAQ